MRAFWSRVGMLIAPLLAIAAAGVAPVGAVPLEAPACAQLQVQYDTLRNEGAAADMARGPEWARANLPPERLQRIATLLAVEEQLSFRCGLAKARITLPTTIEGGEEEIPGPGEATVEGSPRVITLPQKAPPASKRPAAAAAATPPSKQPVAPAPAKKPAATSQPVKASPPQKGPEGAEPKRKAPAKNKKKQPQADDAYRPPPRPKANDSAWAPPAGQ
ncbi:MAG: hypothetical protein ACK4TL_03300 [Hyphomicrobiaceae bacterium]